MEIIIREGKISNVLIIEPFYGGSHKQLIDSLQKYVPNHLLITLPPKKWPWRARCSALTLYDEIPPIGTRFDSLFCSSVLSLAEMLGLRPDLQRLRKIVYFHENEAAYPKQQLKKRDVQFAYNQVTTCLAADVVVFNSDFNRRSFLDGLSHVTGLMPDRRPKRLLERIEAKTKVIYFPVEFPTIITSLRQQQEVLHIVWPHRWEFDKDPVAFVEVLLELHEKECRFNVSLLGGTFVAVPAIFEKARLTLKERLLHFGFVESREEYLKILSKAHVAVSTAQHEFFGVSMMEATHCGCMPLVPKRLVYPEFYPEICLYKTKEQLMSRLRKYCENPNLAIKDRLSFDFDSGRYSSDHLKNEYLKLFTNN